jgi:E-phenylitaconyl-CoA hydratase
MGEDEPMSLVTYGLQDHVATITLNRPEARNAINGALRTELNAAWDRFRDDEDAWVGILTATGDVFCAGGDLKDGEGSVGTFGGTFWEKPTINSFESGMELFKPTIAAVHGPCIGYGLTGVLFCDFVIATTEAVFSYPEVAIGVPTIVGAIRLPRRVGWANAMELLLTGKPMSAQRAKEIGLVWKVVSPDELQEQAAAWARTLTEAAPLAQRATKEVAWRTADMGWIESVRFGEMVRKVAAATEDAAEGVRAWFEKRKPDWTGR